MNWWVETKKKNSTTPDYIENFLFLASAITGCTSIFDFVYLLGVPIGTTNSAIGWKICAIAAEIKKYELIIKRKEKKHNKIVLLAKTKLNSIEVTIFKALINSSISHD